MCDRVMDKGIETPRIEGWTPWPIELHATEEEKRREAEEEEKKKEEEEGRSKIVSPLRDSSVEGVPDSSPPEQQQQSHEQSKQQPQQ